VLGSCQRLPLEVYTCEHPDFGLGSIRNLHAPVEDCYLWWVGSVGLGKAGLAAQGQDIPNISTMRWCFYPATRGREHLRRKPSLFSQMDALMESVFQQFTSLDEI